jgi:small GTP-binding protein
MRLMKSASIFSYDRLWRRTMPQRKICLVGDFAVGKTSLFHRFVYNKFSESYLTTVGVLIQRKMVKIDGVPLSLILWDTEGGQDSSSMKTSYLSGATGAIIVCDLTRLKTILHCEGYVEVLRKTQPAIHIMLAGNKRDLVGEDHAHLAVVRQLSRQLQLPATLTSAKSGDGIEDMFFSLGKSLLSPGSS